MAPYITSTKIRKRKIGALSVVRLLSPRTLSVSHCSRNCPAGRTDCPKPESTVPAACHPIRRCTRHALQQGNTGHKHRIPAPIPSPVRISSLRPGACIARYTFRQIRTTTQTNPTTVVMSCPQATAKRLPAGPHEKRRRLQSAAFVSYLFCSIREPGTQES